MSSRHVKRLRPPADRAAHALGGSSSHPPTTQQDLVSSFFDAVRRRDEAMKLVESAEAERKSILEQISRASTGSLAAPTGSFSAEADARGTKADCDWNKMFGQLLEYKVQHGDTNVNVKSKGDLFSLGRFVGNQRSAYQRTIEGKPEGIKPERMELLNSIGFVWSMRDFHWKEKLEELRRYKDAFGHMNVPRGDASTEKGRLRRWMDDQRSSYRRKQANKPHTLTEERIEALEKIGFEWYPPPEEARPGPNRGKRRQPDGTFTVESILSPSDEEELEQDFDKWWEAKMTDMENHHMEHCSFHRSSMPEKLGRFASWCRKQYKLREEDKLSWLSQERMEHLELLGFDWMSTPNKRRRTQPTATASVEKASTTDMCDGREDATEGTDLGVMEMMGEKEDEKDGSEDEVAAELLSLCK